MTICVAEHCGRRAKAKGLCWTHYMRLRRTGGLAARPIRKAGTGGINAAGYLVVAGRPAHRIVMERQLGRPLRRAEVVHHRDGDRLNNDPANLVMLPSAAAHRRLHTGRPRECTAFGCRRIHYARGYCEMHYARLRRGSPSQARESSIRTGKAGAGT